MPETFYQWLVFVLPLVLAASMGMFPKHFEKRAYRYAVVSFCILFSIFVYFQMAHEKKVAAEDRDKAVAEIRKEYDGTVTAQAQKIGELEGYVQAQSKDVRETKNYTVANTAQLRALWEKTQTGQRTRETIMKGIDGRIKWASMALGVCTSVGPPGSGGSDPRGCLDLCQGWNLEVRDYLLGSLDEAYTNRFDEAGLPNHLPSVPQTSLDSRSAALIELPVKQMESRADVLKQIAGELAEKF